MPFFRINSDLHYFCHVPKCGGASVESYLQERFGELAFLNSNFYRRQEGHRWTKTSPQHIDVQAIALLFPKKWIKSSFAVVRHPISRIRSAFDYQRVGERTIAPDANINDWIQDYSDNYRDTPYIFDQHLRPASDLIVPGSSVFRLEDGLEGIVPYLDKLAGNTQKPRAIPHTNKSRSGSDYQRTQEEFTPISRKHIAEIYKEDFRKFGYICSESFTEGIAVPAIGKMALSTRLRGA
jgi:hypothetical protein